MDPPSAVMFALADEDRTRFSFPPEKSEPGLRTTGTRDTVVSAGRTNCCSNILTNARWGIELVAPFIITLLVLMVAFPLCIFGCSAVFGAMLYAVECPAASADGLCTSINTAAHKSDCLECEYFEWLLYICGNLVTLATPLTEVSPKSGHRGAEILDLVLSAWSLSVTAVAIGMIISLSSVTRVAHNIDKAANPQNGRHSGALLTEHGPRRRRSSDRGRRACTAGCAGASSRAGRSAWRIFAVRCEIADSR